METVYLDNAATSFPKPPQVLRQMARYLEEVGATVNRSVYGPAQAAGMVELRLRQRLCQLFHFTPMTHAVLTPGNTWGLNLALSGFLRPGDHCVVSSMEHNAVMRPLQALAKQGVTFTRVPCDAVGRLEPKDVENALQPDTRLVVLSHGSNVSGTVQDAAAVGEICYRHRIPFCLDGAQTAGHIPVDFSALGLSALSVPGHKGLLGPSGMGALLLDPSFAARLTPTISGGTGSASDSEEIPSYMPDRFEPGTPNVPGIYGLEAALQYLEWTGVEAIAAHDRDLTARFLDGVRSIPTVTLIGPDTLEDRVGVVSLDFPGRDNAEVAEALEREFGILTRCGLHCAPSAHKTLGTFPRGTIRFSWGWFSTESDIDRALEAIRSV